MEKFKASIILKLNKLKHKREIYVKLLKVKKENEKLGNIMIDAAINLIGAETATFCVNNYKVNFSNYENLTIFEVIGFGEVSLYNFVGGSVYFTLYDFDKKLIYGNKHIFIKDIGYKWRDKLIYKTDTKSELALQKKLNIILKITTEVYHTVKKEEDIKKKCLFKNEMLKLENYINQ